MSAAILRATSGGSGRIPQYESVVIERTFLALILITSLQGANMKDTIVWVAKSPDMSSIASACLGLDRA
jgi:hypothetical protein